MLRESIKGIKCVDPIFQKGEKKSGFQKLQMGKTCLVS